MNESDPHSLICVNVCSPVTDTAWEELGGVAMTRRCVLGGGLGDFKSLQPFLVVPLFLACSLRCDLLPVPTT